MLKAGVLWDDVHLKAHEIAIDGLLKLGVLQGEKEDILRSRTSVAFFPHGLGHYLGMDTHDTGGHPNYDDKDSMFRYLRVRGKLPAGSIITVEPGVSFFSLLYLSFKYLLILVKEINIENRSISAALSLNRTLETRFILRILILIP